MRKHSLYYALALAPLLMGAGGVGVSRSALKVDKLPICGDDQYLSYASGGLSCISIASGGAFSAPDCETEKKLLTSKKGGDILGLACTTKGQSGGAIDVTKLVNLEKKVTDLTSIITSIENTPAKGISTYVGNTTGVYDGNFQGGVTGAANGFDGAAKACSTQYGAGAHLCTAYEIYESATSGVIASGKEIVKAWVYFPSWNNTSTSSLDPLLGQGDTCGSLTYPTGDKFWTGVAVSTGPNSQTTRWSVRFHGGADAKCSVKLPMSCCK